MAVYISRKYKIAYGSSKNVELLFKGLIKARIKHDFIFYSHMKKLEKFEEVWSVENVLCWIENFSNYVHFVNYTWSCVVNKYVVKNQISLSLSLSLSLSSLSLSLWVHAGSEWSACELSVSVTRACFILSFFFFSFFGVWFRSI